MKVLNNAFSSAIPSELNLRVAADSILTAMLVAVAARLGVDFTMGPENFATLWLVNGLMSGTLLSVKTRLWPIYLIAGFLGNYAGLVSHPSEVHSPGIIALFASLNMLESAVIARVLSPFMNNLQGRGVIRFATAFVLMAVIAAPLVAAMLAGIVLKFLDGAAFGPAFIQWFLSDALGMAMAAPITLIIREVDFGTFVRRQFDLETISILTAIALVSFAVFYFTRYPVAYAVLPLIVLAAFRTGLSGAALANLVAAPVMLAGTIAGYGPFIVSPDSVINLRIAQSYVLVCLLLSLPVAMAVIAHRRIALAWKMTADMLEKQLLFDPTSGLSSRRMLMKELQKNWGIALKSGKPLTLALIAIDDFEMLWRHYDRLQTENSVRSLARRLSLITREGDTLIRMSDREFAVLMPGADKKMARAIVQDFQAAANFHSKWSTRKLTLSVGIASFRPSQGQDSEALLDFAELALMDAKRRGGNCTESLGDN